VKTEFHSGRYAVVFSPGNQTPPAFASSNYLYREVLDLRESNEFTITIPYTSTLPYLQFDSIMGYVSVFAINPLVAPTTVSPTVTCLVEVCADDTFEVAVPRSYFATPLLYVPGTGAPTVDEEDVVFEAQALGEDVQAASRNVRTQIPAPSIAGLPNNDGGLASSMYCIGEKITSFRALAKRAAPYYQRLSGTETLIALRPKILGFQNSSDNVPSLLPLAVDYVSIVGALFSYQRGGLKFTIYGPDDYLRAGLAPNALGTSLVVAIPPASESTATSNCLAIATGPKVSGGVTVIVPQYARTHCEMYRLYTTNTYTLPSDIYCSDLRLYIKANSPLTNLRVLRQAADDWECGFFTGVLPVYNGGGIAAVATF
jgi:hypothetical protein